MAQSKKRVTLRKRKSTVRKPSKSVRGQAAKRAATKLRSKKAVAKTKRPKAEKVARKKARPLKPPVTPVAETTIVDVEEKPAPAVAEFDETDIREADASREPPEES